MLQIAADSVTHMTSQPFVIHASPAVDTATAGSLSSGQMNYVAM